MENQAEIDYAREERIRGAAMRLYRALWAIRVVSGLSCLATVDADKLRHTLSVLNDKADLALRIVEGGQ